MRITWVAVCELERENYEKRQSKPEAATAAAARRRRSKKNVKNRVKKSQLFVLSAVSKYVHSMCILYSQQEVSVAAAATAPAIHRCCCCCCWCLYIDVCAHIALQHTVHNTHIVICGRLSFHFILIFFAAALLAERFVFMFSFSRHFGDSRILSIRVERYS